MSESTKKHGWVLLAILFTAAASRLFPHPWNLAPIGGMALLASAKVPSAWRAWILPLSAFWLSDLILNNTVYAAYYEGFVWASTSFLFSAIAILLIILMGRVVLSHINLLRLAGAAVLASILFFLISNFGVWWQGTLYPKTVAGLLEAYVAGLPFLKGTMVGDLVWTGLLFGVWHLIFHSKPIPVSAHEYVNRH